MLPVLLKWKHIIRETVVTNKSKFVFKLLQRIFLLESLKYHTRMPHKAQFIPEGFILMSSIYANFTIIKFFKIITKFQLNILADIWR